MNEALNGLLPRGGGPLAAIALVSTLPWLLALERYWYYASGWRTRLAKERREAPTQSVLLLTTVLGLVVAIPTLFIRGALLAKSRHLVHELDRKAAELIANAAARRSPSSNLSPNPGPGPGPGHDPSPGPA